jgi:hypothetical protein
MAAYGALETLASRVAPVTAAAAIVRGDGSNLNRVWLPWRVQDQPLDGAVGGGVQSPQDQPWLFAVSAIDEIARRARRPVLT